YFSRPGALADFFEWFGPDGVPHYTEAFLNGAMTLKESVTEMAKSPVNKLAQGLGSAKPVLETIPGRTAYRDVVRRRRAGDRWRLLAQAVGLENEYDELRGRPTRGYALSVEGIFYYRLDPEEIAYNEIRSLKAQFLTQKGKAGDAFVISPRSNALYY